MGFVFMSDCPLVYPQESVLYLFILYHTVVLIIAQSSLYSEWMCTIFVFCGATNEKYVCSSDIPNKPSHEFRMGYWLEGSSLESNYIKDCCGNICNTENAADDKQGHTRH